MSLFPVGSLPTDGRRRTAMRPVRRTRTADGIAAMANPPDCERCGDTLSPKNKDMAGHYRDKCWKCICEVAGTTPEDAKRSEPPEYE